ncbi:hypothetical protein WJX81_002697 [Elliptochloris bilobata]|uniref:Uncharacterized protein n=1 Tax=Elliptochloris bilobata TaxID=381761 RepID=A0AAW1RGC1_9CHLO
MGGRPASGQQATADPDPHPGSRPSRLRGRASRSTGQLRTLKQLYPDEEGRDASPAGGFQKQGSVELPRTVCLSSSDEEPRAPGAPADEGKGEGEGLGAEGSERAAAALRRSGNPFVCARTLEHGRQVLRHPRPAERPPPRERPGQTEALRCGACHELPWWHRLPDFVPVAALRGGMDPRSGAHVHVNYMRQFCERPAPGGATARRVGGGDEAAGWRRAAGSAGRGRSGGGGGGGGGGTGDPGSSGRWVTEGGAKVFVAADGTRHRGKAAWRVAKSEPGAARSGSSGGRKRRRRRN